MAQRLAEVGSKLRQYEQFLNDVLRPDLQRSTDLRQKLLLDLREYEDLETNLASLEKEGSRELRTMVDLGGEVYCQAHVPDTSHVFINVGLGFHLECALGEAPRVIQLRKEVLQAKVQQATEQNAKIKAQIKMVEGGLAELMNLKDA